MVGYFWFSSRASFFVLLMLKAQQANKTGPEHAARHMERLSISLSPPLTPEKSDRLASEWNGRLVQLIVSLSLEL